MKYERKSTQATLKYFLTYTVSDVEDREVPYSRTGQMYRPDCLQFTLLARPPAGSEHPRFQELQVDSIYIGGKKVKKDGSTGITNAHERFWSGEYGLPDWVMPMVEYTIRELRESL